MKVDAVSSALFDDWTCSSGKLIKWESLASHSDDIQCQLTCVTLKNELALILYCLRFALSLHT